MILESDPQQVLQKVNYRVGHSGSFSLKSPEQNLSGWTMLRLAELSTAVFSVLPPLLTCFTFLSPPFSLSSSSSSPGGGQLVSEQAYGFVLFDYITGNLEAQTDRSQLL